MVNSDQSQELATFVDKLVAEKQITDVSEEVLAQMKEDLLSRVEDRINAELIAVLSPEQMAEFDKIMDSGDQGQMQDYLKQAIPDLETVVASALIKFRATYLGINP
jgi:hypothetical protein